MLFSRPFPKGMAEGATGSLGKRICLPGDSIASDVRSSCFPADAGCNAARSLASSAPRSSVPQRTPDRPSHYRSWRYQTLAPGMITTGTNPQMGLCFPSPNCSLIADLKVRFLICTPLPSSKALPLIVPLIADFSLLPLMFNPRYLIASFTDHSIRPVVFFIQVKKFYGFRYLSK